MIDLPIKELIVIHVNYRDVFNAPVNKDDLKKWIANKPSVHEYNKIELAIEELIVAGLIIEKNGLLAVSGKEKSIELQGEKSILAQSIIDKGKNFLNIIGKLPFIKFIGVSGSIAADNPTLDANNHVDLDLFVICSKNSLWLIFLVERIFTNTIRLLRGDHFFCFNYVTEEDFLEVYNKNFYTASEIVNLKTIVDKGIFNKFISSNQWFRKYYSNQCASVVNEEIRKPHYIQKLFYPFNYTFFFIFCLLKTLKKRNMKYLWQFQTNFDPTSRGNLQRISTPNGGYQEKIKLRFSSLLSTNFPEYTSSELMDDLFPLEESFSFSEVDNLDDRETHRQFKKYA